VKSKQLPLAISGLCLFLIGFSGCSINPRAPETVSVQKVSAEQAFANGKYVLAATTWQQDALDADPAEAASYRVRAADAWLLANQPGPAADLLQWISRDDLNSSDRARLDLVLADLALREERPDEAQLHLEQSQLNLPASSRGRYDALNARTQEILLVPRSQDISNAAVLSDAMRNYDSQSALELINLLEGVSSGELALRADNPRTERRLTGWLDLALVIRQNLVEPEQVAGAIAQWKTRHSQHPVTEADALDLWLHYREQFQFPRKVAVLLPESGRLASAGAAVRDGLISAYVDNPGAAEILFFPTGEQPDSAISAYFTALDAGADWIIGPLQKESIDALLALAGLSTPLLALNELPSNFAVPPGLQGQILGLSLSQEREAASIAGNAIEHAYQRAVVLAPESEWGDRMAAAFQQEFLQDGREIIAAARYQEADNDYGPLIERILKIDESKARKQRLEATLQMPVEFEAVRRNDIDLIFLAASASQARAIRPQLRFYDAGDIPVYSTGRVYTGRPDRIYNQDLNGIRFPITPWQLEHTEMNDLPDLESIRSGTLAPLYAVGHDSWNILPWLELMKKDPDFDFKGASGSYRARNHNELVREPAWAFFSRGRPVALENAMNDGNQDADEE